MSKLLTEMQPETKMPKTEIPTCPGCRQDLTEIKSRAIQVGEVVVQLMWCGNPECRQALMLPVIGQVPKNTIAVPGMRFAPCG